jgi:hypothetical protein
MRTQVKPFVFQEVCMARRKTQEEFLADAVAVHSDSYDYSKVVYTRSIDKVIVTCKEHGDFPLRADIHLAGAGCPYCSGASHNTVSYINKAKIVHGDKYDYSPTEFITSYTKSIIICPTHGEFPQTPNIHLNGHGCPKCVGMNKTTEEFIADAKAVHGDKYDYSETRYVIPQDELVIICPEHGEFVQSPYIHLRGSGCNKCAKHGFDPSKESTFYVYTFGDYAGFGITNDFETRNAKHLSNFKKKNIDATLLVNYNMSGKSAQSLERHLKKTLDIVDSGVEGFKTEAVIIQHLPKLISELEEHVPFELSLVYNGFIKSRNINQQGELK